MTIRQTDDGCNTIYLPEMDEHYHSTKGALTEARHIFIGMGYDHCAKPAPRVIEFGFGTGLNALLTAIQAEAEGRHTTYTALEIDPLDATTVSALHYDKVAGPEWGKVLEAMHRAEWGSVTEITSCLTLKKVRCNFNYHCMWMAKRSYDIAYFDAFAPDKQAGVWTAELFAAIHESLDHGGMLVTYCAKGEVRRCLQSVGFTVERLPGPPGGKREMLRATKP